MARAGLSWRRSHRCCARGSGLRAVWDSSAHLPFPGCGGGGTVRRPRGSVRVLDEIMFWRRGRCALWRVHGGNRPQCLLTPRAGRRSLRQFLGGVSVPSAAAVVLSACPPSDTCFLTLPSPLPPNAVSAFSGPWRPPRRRPRHLPACSAGTHSGPQPAPPTTPSCVRLHALFASLQRWCPCPPASLSLGSGGPSREVTRRPVTAAGLTPSPFPGAAFCTAPALGSVHTHVFSPARLSLPLPCQPLFPVLGRGTVPAAAWAWRSRPRGDCPGDFPRLLPMLRSSSSETRPLLQQLSGCSRALPFL